MNNKTIPLQEDTSSEKMATLSDSVNHASKKGYTTDFRVKPNGMMWDSKDQYYDPEEVMVDNFYRFEGESDPGDSAILYLVSTVDGKKGMLIDAYGAYDDANVSDFIRRVEAIQKEAHLYKSYRLTNDRKRYIAASLLFAVSGLLFLSMSRNKKC